MNRVNKKDIDFKKLPQQAGVYLFSDDSSVIFVGRSANLQQSIQRLLEPGEDDKDVFQLASLTTEISFQSTDDLFSALMQEKILLKKYSPEFNSSLKLHEKYAYLAVDFYKVPFLHITENTSEEFYYLGPFQNRFFVYDFIDIMADKFQFPACENEKYPCYKLKHKTCLGWCLKDKTEIGEILLNSFMKPDEIIMNNLQNEFEKLEIELEFLQAEQQKKKLQIVQKFYDFIKFFHVTKKLNFEFFMNEKSIKIENGMLAEIAENDKYQNFTVFNPEYRENEILAHDKTQMAERWIVYNFLKKNKLEQINIVQKKALHDFDKVFEVEEK